MSDTILQAVLADLRPKLADKMRREMDEMGTGGGGGGSSSKSKSPVEVHRAENYQFAFFFRKTDSRHVVLLKVSRVHPSRHRRIYLSDDIFFFVS